MPLHASISAGTTPNDSSCPGRLPVPAPGGAAAMGRQPTIQAGAGSPDRQMRHSLYQLLHRHKPHIALAKRILHEPGQGLRVLLQQEVARKGVGGSVQTICHTVIA